MSSIISSSCPQSPIMYDSKSNQKCIKISSKRKLLLSPSKDLLIFFDSSQFSKFNPINIKKEKQNNTKLKLDRKNIDENKNSEQKIQREIKNKQYKTFSTTNSTQSLVSNKNKKVQKEQRFMKLKQQVDKIRRKYSYSKLGYNKELKKVNSTQFIRVPSQMISINNSNYSLNNSKQKISCLTPKNDRYLGKKILTKNVFAQKPHRNLKLTQNKIQPQNKSNKLDQTIKLNHNDKFNSIIQLNTHESQVIRRKGSYQFQNITQSLNLNQQIKDNNIFQFTFGTMALMDFKNKQLLKNKSKKISL